MTEPRTIEELIREEIRIGPYDPTWPVQFEREATFLLHRLPKNLIRRIEHFGSTAVPGLAAKPVIDILVEVSDLEETKRVIVPILQSDGYQYFWRPTIDDQPPFYAWFIKRNTDGQRTHHIHMVEADSALWDRLFFRDYLRLFADEADRYERLKRSLADRFSDDRVAYTKEKSQYIISVTKKARVYFSQLRPDGGTSPNTQNNGAGK